MPRNETFHRTDLEYRAMADRLLDKAPLDPADRAAVRAFIDEAQATGHISASRRYKLTQMVCGLARFCPAPFGVMTTRDAYEAVDRIHTGATAWGAPLSQNSQHDYTKTLKRLLLWLIENDLAAPGLKRAKVQKIRPPTKPVMTKTAAQMLAPSEVTAMIEACLSSRDRALIATLWEGGFRIGEMGSLTWGQVEFNPWRCAVNVDAKTERPRFVPLVMARPYLAAWRADYPGETTPGAYVFLDQYGRPARYPGLRKQVLRIAERAGIEKHVTPHLFRHSRITTLMRDGIKESTIKRMLWGNITTDMFATYAHLTDADIESEFQAHYGLIDRPPRDAGADPRQCPRCHRINGPTDLSCRDCGFPFNEAAAAEMDLLRYGLYRPEVLRKLAAALERGELTLESGRPGEPCDTPPPSRGRARRP